MNNSNTTPEAPAAKAKASPPATREALTSGSFITPTVRLVKPLAEGGMGRVWLADHLGLESKVVVKLMAEEIAARADGAERFTREAMAAAAIKSPHVVQVFDHGVTAGGVPYIVMELLDGKDLGQWLEQHGRMEIADVVTLVTQIGKALAKAHKAGIVHRDIKPDNIFLSSEGDDGGLFVKLLDFGTAKREANKASALTSSCVEHLVGLRPTRAPHYASLRSACSTIPGQIMGTPYYMSPEQSVGAEINERTDIWSLGVVAFEALTGRKPFDGQSIGAITIAIHGPLPMITDFAWEAPREIDVWFARACALLPQDRFQSIREATNAFVLAATGSALAPTDQPTESIVMPGTVKRVVRSGTATATASASERPVAMDIAAVTVSEFPSAVPPPPSLIASLPKAGSERLPTMIAAAIVMAIAGIAMTAIVLSRSSAPAVTTTTAAAAPSPALLPPKPLETAEPSITAPAANEEEKEVETKPPPPAPAPARVSAPTPKKPTTPVVVAAKPTPPAARPLLVKAAASSTAHDDDDLAALTKVTSQRVEPQTPAPTPTTPPLPSE